VVAFLVAVWVMALAACLAAVVRDPEPELRHPAVAVSAAATVGWMLLAWAGMLNGGRFARLA
jgi:hypothetical protein